MAEEALAEFMSVSRDIYTYLTQNKGPDNGKVIGCLPMHCPEEILHAAGARPAVLLESHETISMADLRLQSFFCELGRSFVDIGMKGKLDCLDGLVLPDTCHTVRGLSHISERNFAPAYHESLFLPCALDYPHSKSYVIEELARFRSSIQRFTGQEVTDERLWHSIEVYNESRRLLRRVYELRRSKPGIIKAGEMLAIVVAGMVMPREQYNEALARLLPELERRDSIGKGVKLLLSGSLCLCPDVGLLNLIEDVGGVIVDDDLYTGSRYFASDVDTSGDPLKALADRYLQMTPPCPTRHNPDNDWADYLITMARESGAQGAITLLAKFCEPHSFYIPYLEERLTGAGIPHLVLETVPEMGSTLGQARTRIQAFLEIVEGM